MSVSFVVLAAAFVLCGFLMPSEKVASALVGDSGLPYKEVLMGTQLFRLGLVLNGLAFVGVSVLRSLIPDGAATDLTNPPRRVEIVDDNLQRGQWFVVVFIVVAAGLLRLVGLNSGLWYDEIATLVEFARLPLNELLASYGDQNNHPLFSLLAGLSMSLFGESAWSLRLPALLFGLASIWALFRLAEFLSDKREAFLAVILMAVSYHHVWFSQNARGYTGQLFWCLLGTLLFLKGYKQKRLAIWIAYALSMALGMYTHLTTVFVVISHFTIYAFVLVKQRVTRHNGPIPILWPTIAFVLIGLFTFQLYALVLPQVVSSFQVQVDSGRVETWTNPIWALMEVVRGLQIGFGTVFAGAVAAFVFLCGLIDYARSNRAVVALIAVPLAIGAMVLLALHRHFFPRFFFFELGMGILVFVRGTTVVADLLAKLTKCRMPVERVGRVLGTTLAGIIIVASAFSLCRNYRHPKQDFAGALSYVEKGSSPDDLVATVGLASYVYDRYYEARVEAVETAAEMRDLASRGKPVWLIYTFSDHLDSFYPEIASLVRDDYTIVQSFPGTVGGGTVFVCKDKAFSGHAAETPTAPANAEISTIH